MPLEIRFVPERVSGEADWWFRCRLRALPVLAISGSLLLGCLVSSPRYTHWDVDKYHSRVFLHAVEAGTVCLVSHSEQRDARDDG